MAVLACLGVNAAQAAAPYRGRAVDAVLDELATAADVQLVYTSAVVPVSTIVDVEPSPGPALETLMQVLAPLGLKLQRVEGRVYSIVPVSQSPDSSTTASALPAARSITPTRAPSSTKRETTARPMPEPPPVTNAT